VSRGRRRSPLRAFGAHVPLVIVALVTMFPFYSMVILSLRGGQRLSLPGSLIPVNFSLDAYRNILNYPDLWQWMWNTLVYSGVSVVLVLLISSSAAYVFAKKQFVGKNFLFWLVMSTLMVPYQMTLVPQFLLIAGWGGVNTQWGLIVPSLVNIYALFLMRQFIQGLPDQLFEAAQIDGASEFRVFWTIVLPLVRPVLATLGVFVFLWHWNDFLWPLVITRSADHFVVTVGLLAMQTKEGSLTLTMAGAVITFLPILVIYALLQRFFVRGVVTSGLK
jgi:multiple sugar transport system permease protein